MSATATTRGCVAVVLPCIVLLVSAGAFAVSRNTVAVPDSGCGASVTAAATASEPWQTARVFDHRGASGAPVLAATVRVPAGWQAQLSRDAHDCAHGQITCLLWSARDAEGSTGVELLPFRGGLLFHDYAGDGRAQPLGVEDYLRDLARQRQPRAEIIGFESAPELAANPPFELMPSPHREAGRLTLRYRQRGSEVHEMLAAVVGEPSRLPGIAEDVPLPRFAQAYAAYAPVGRFDIARAEKIVGSWRMDDAWRDCSNGRRY